MLIKKVVGTLKINTALMFVPYVLRERLIGCSNSQRASGLRLLKHILRNKK